MANILLGVSGGIAAYKALELVRLATGAGHAVRAIQTPSSRRFVGSASLRALTGAPVLVGEFDEDPMRGAFPGEQPPPHEPIGHLELARKADLLLIAPASANTIAKLAGGFADNLLCSAALAVECPVIVAPAMNNHMYEHAATQGNLQTLRSRGVVVLPPGEGRLASIGEEGRGRLPEPAELLRACEQQLEGRSQPWSGMKVLITAGGTREPLDGVRFIGNRSSGRMGLALAQAAMRRGADVTVIAANVSLARPAGVTWIEASTAAEMKSACERELPGCDVLLMAAAVADFRPAEPVDGKIKKAGRERLTLELEATPDVLSGLTAVREPSQTIVGFAAEHGEQALGNGRQKLLDKGLDAVVVNDVSRTDIGFEAQENEVSIVSRSWETMLSRAPKRDIAEAILDAVQRLREDDADRR